MKRAGSAALLAALMLGIALSRWHSYAEPVDWDVATYAVMGHELNCGAALYRDTWDDKPPAIYLSYALAERLTGFGLPEIFCCSLICSGLTLLAVYRAAGAAGPTAAIVAAVLWVLIGGDLTLDANRPNTESFINAALAWAVALTVRRPERSSSSSFARSSRAIDDDVSASGPLSPVRGGEGRGEDAASKPGVSDVRGPSSPSPRPFPPRTGERGQGIHCRVQRVPTPSPSRTGERASYTSLVWQERNEWTRREVFRLLLVGLLIALATLYKQIAIVPGVLVVLAAGDTGRRRLIDTSIVLATIATVWLIVLACFAATGRGGLAWTTLWTYPRFYSGNWLNNFILSLRPANLFPPPFYDLLGTIALAVAALVWPPTRRLQRVLLALLIGTYVAVFLPGRFLLHYYQLWLAPLAVAGGIGAAALRRVSPRWIAPLGIAGCVAGTAWSQAWPYALPLTTLAERNYGVYVNWITPTARYLAARLAPGETFYDYATWPSLYLMTQRRPPGVTMWPDHLRRGPMAETLTRQTLARLRAAPPRWVIVSIFDEINPDEPVSRWIGEHYRPVDDGVNRMPLKLLERRAE